MRLLRFIHEQITNPITSHEVNGEQPLPETSSEPELNEEGEHSSLHSAAVASGI